MVCKEISYQGGLIGKGKEERECESAKSRGINPIMTFSTSQSCLNLITSQSPTPSTIEL